MHVRDVDGRARGTSTYSVLHMLLGMKVQEAETKLHLLVARRKSSRPSRLDLDV